MCSTLAANCAACPLRATRVHFTAPVGSAVPGRFPALAAARNAFRKLRQLYTEQASDGRKMMKLVPWVCAAVLLGVVYVRAETVNLWKTTPPYPDVVVISHATPQVALFFKSYFTAKSEHKPAATTDHFFRGAPDLYRRGLRLAVLQ